MHILVTGGFGYLGTRICDYYRNKGYDVTILSRRRHDVYSDWVKNFRVITADISDSDAVKGSCENVDVVIHTAAMNEVACKKFHKEAVLINGYGTRNMLQEALDNSVKKFIYFSTFHVYGIPKKKIIDENTMPNPINSYSITHMLAEYYCSQFSAESGLKTFILRPTNGYGAPLFKDVDRWSLVLNDFCKMIYNEGKIVLKTTGEQQRDFVSISDIIQAADIFVENDISCGDNRAFNVGAGKNISIKELAQIVSTTYNKRYNKKSTIELAPDAKPPDIKSPFLVSIEKIRSLGYKPTGNLETEINKIFDLLEGNKK